MAKNKSYNKLIAGTMTAAMVAGVVAPVAASADTKKFTDVLDGQWYTDAINDMAAKGIIAGKGDGTFGLGEAVNRGQVATFIVKAKGITVDKNDKPSFTDVDENSYYINFIAAAEKNKIMSGIGEGKFGPDNQLTRVEMAQILVNAYGFKADENNKKSFEDIKDLTWGTEAIETLASLEIVKGDGKNFNPHGVVTREQAAQFIYNAMNYKTPEVKETKAESVTAIDEKTLEVKFNKELTKEEQEKLAFDVDVNGSKGLFKVAEVKGNKATLTRTSNIALEEGKYEVTVKGISKEWQVVKTEVKAKTPTTLEVTTDKLVGDTAKAKVGLTLKDQYNKEYKLNESDYEVVAYNKTQKLDVAGSVGFDSKEKSFFLNTTAKHLNDTKKVFAENDVVAVTFVHKESGLKVTKDLTVVAGAHLSALTFGEVELPEGKTRLTEDLTNVKFAYTAKDQYGNAVELNLSDVAVVSSDEEVVKAADVTFDKDNKKVKINKFGKSGKATLTFINKVTGEVTQVKLDVLQKAGQVNNVELEKDALDLAANNGVAYVGLTVTDQYGDKLKASEYTKDLSNKFTISTTNNSIATATIVTDEKDKDFGKLKVTLNPEAKKGNKATINVTVNKTGQTAKLNVVVGEEAVPSTVEIHKDSKHTTKLAKGAKTTVKYVVKDQYGNDVVLGAEYKLDVKAKDDSKSITNTTPEFDAKDKTYAVEVTGAEVGATDLVAKLVKVKGEEEISKKELSFNIVENSSVDLTYTIAEIPTLYKGATGVDSEYAKEIKLEAKDKDGNVVVIPTSSIVDVKTSNGEVAKVGKNKDGKWVVYGVAPVKPEDKADKTAAISIVYNAKDGVKTLTKDVTVSGQDLAAKEIKIKDKAVDAADAKDAKEVKDFAITNANAINVPTGAAHLWVEDQFGGYSIGKATQGVEIKVVANNDNTEVAAGTTVATLDADLSNTFKAKDIKKDAQVRLVATASNGASGYLTVTIKSDVLKTLADMDAKIKEAEAAVTAAQAKVDTATAKLAPAQKKVADAEKALADSAETDKTALQAAVDTAKTELTAVEGEVAAAAAELKTAQDKLAELKK